MPNLTATELAQQLLDWNRQHLLAHCNLTTDQISQCFAEHFMVRANGREYQANLDNYLTFLQGFKQNIAKIDYRVSQTITQGNAVVLCMSADITRTDNQQDHFTAMLLLEFNTQGKVTLWQEVYVQNS